MEAAVELRLKEAIDQLLGSKPITKLELLENKPVTAIKLLDNKPVSKIDLNNIRFTEKVHPLNNQ